MNRAMLRPGQTIIICVIALLTLGIVMVTSAGLTIDAERAVSFEGMLTGRSMIYALAAVGLMFAASCFPVQWLRGPTSRGISPANRIIATPATWLLLLSIVCLCLVYVGGIGKEVNGARRWVYLGPASWRLSFQPSELAKWAMVIVVASYVVHLGAERMRQFWSGLVPALVITMLVCGLIVLEDLGTAVLIGAVALFLLFAGGARWWHIGILFPLPVAGVAAAVLTSEYRMNRIESFLNPYADPQDTGYHMIQSMVAVAEGHITGRGLGHGVYKFGYLPEDTTDFLFAVICEELGIFGAALVVFLYLTLLLAAAQVIRRQSDALCRFVGLGIAATIGMQAVINLMVVTGLAPTKGIALPLLSSGGTGWMLTAACLGLLVGMDRRTAPDTQPQASREDVPAGLPALGSPV
ncbi:MAG: cell division protein FtsW [Phycisphaerales bacterium]|nr:cell division protein FtsW [Phycisphaerales bacterium]